MKERKLCTRWKLGSVDDEPSPLRVCCCMLAGWHAQQCVWYAYICLISVCQCTTSGLCCWKDTILDQIRPFENLVLGLTPPPHTPNKAPFFTVEETVWLSCTWEHSHLKQHGFTQHTHSGSVLNIGSFQWWPNRKCYHLHKQELSQSCNFEPPDCGGGYTLPHWCTCWVSDLWNTLHFWIFMIKNSNRKVLVEWKPLCLT